MKIKKISCSQFAGMRDKSVSFSDGINVVFGMNESGKSTLVNLIFRTLFQNARLDGRSDREFRELYFPGAFRDRPAAGDFIDGSITFEDENGSYTLTKEWGADPRCTFSTPAGIIRDQNTIKSELEKILHYGEGVYSDMLFSSQRNADSSLKDILNSAGNSNAKQDITVAVTQAFAESGIPVDAIEQAIEKRISDIQGEHWDVSRNIPMKKTGSGRWAKGLGEIHKAYHRLEDARNVLNEKMRCEAEADSAAADFALKDAGYRAADNELLRFRSFAGKLQSNNEHRKTIDRLNKELNKLREILQQLPALSESLDRAKTLLAEKEHRELIDKYEAAKKLQDEYEKLAAEAESSPCPTDEEITKVRAAQRTAASLENKLCGMNLIAAVEMLGGNTLEVTSLRTGERLDVSGDGFALTEAVNITVPGVMKMQLAPANVDVGEVSGKIAAQREIIDGIFSRYGVSDLAELEQLARKLTAAKTKADTASDRLSVLLGGADFDELREAAGNITGEVRTAEEIGRDIRAVCGATEPGKFITAKETILESYSAEYGSIGELGEKISAVEKELAKAEKSVLNTDDIPAEYLGISDPESHMTRLQEELEAAREIREQALTEKAAAISRLEKFQEDLSADPSALVEAAERAFEEQKSLLGHWLHIAEVFRERREGLHNTPMQDIADSFTRYLGAISGGRVSSAFPETDKLNMNIYSGDRLVDYGKLSEGTKETVSLAFRLAVLDHLFPEGGVIVLDDPFTDMDAARAEQSCELLKKCAEKHQVIFLTCREDYIPSLNGNTIRL